MSRVGLLCLVICLFGSCFVTEAIWEQKYYEQFRGHAVLRFTVESEAEAHTVLDFAQRLHLDVWLAERRLPGFIDVQIDTTDPALQHQLQILQSFLTHPPQTFVDNIAQRLKEQLMPNLQTSPLLSSSSSTSSSSSFSSTESENNYFLAYHPYAEILKFMEDLAQQYPTLVQTFVLGTTVEGNTITGVQITRSHNDSKGINGEEEKKKEEEEKKKKTLFLTGCIHAREWISAATMTYLMQSLVESSEDDNQSLIDRYRWVIVPVVNVDGYLFTWSDNRLWRKNRRKNDAVCWGVDNNRNFQFEWDQAGATNDPCDQTFAGPSAASEPETQAVQNLITSTPHLIAYGDIHAYGQLWMSPWGYTSALPPSNDYYRQNNCSVAVADAIYSVHKKVYKTGPIATTIYPASGNSADFAYGVKRVLYSFAAELRGTQNSAYGFLLPANQIIPQGQEFFAGILAMIDYIQSHP